MVPVKAILTSDGEFIGEITPGGDGILVYVRWHTFNIPVHMVANLCYPGDSIHIWCSTLKKAY